MVRGRSGITSLYFGSFMTPLPPDQQKSEFELLPLPHHHLMSEFA